MMHAIVSAWRSQGAVMEFVEKADDRPEPISIARCRELLDVEVESITDQEVELILRPYCRIGNERGFHQLADPN